MPCHATPPALILPSLTGTATLYPPPLTRVLSSFGQLHTVMSLVANGARPHTKNLAGETAVSDARRERHAHVVKWLEAWERAGKPAAPTNWDMRRTTSNDAGAANGANGGGKRGFEAHDAQGCYVGACIIPCLVTTFYVQPSSADELRASYAAPAPRPPAPYPPPYPHPSASNPRTPPTPLHHPSRPTPHTSTPPPPPSRSADSPHHPTSNPAANVRIPPMLRSGFTLFLPWSYALKRSSDPRWPNSSKFELRAADNKQDWTWHRSGCCFWGSPGWWAVKVVPTNLCC